MVGDELKGEEGDERRAVTNLCQDGGFLPAVRRKPQENLSLSFGRQTIHTQTHIRPAWCNKYSDFEQY